MMRTDFGLKVRDNSISKLMEKPQGEEISKFISFDAIIATNVVKKIEGLIRTTDSLCRIMGAELINQLVELLYEDRVFPVKYIRQSNV